MSRGRLTVFPSTHPPPRAPAPLQDLSSWQLCKEQLQASYLEAAELAKQQHAELVAQLKAQHVAAREAAAKEYAAHMATAQTEHEVLEVEAAARNKEVGRLAGWLAGWLHSCMDPCI